LTKHNHAHHYLEKYHLYARHFMLDSNPAAYYDHLKFISRQKVADSFIKRFRKTGGPHSWDIVTLSSVKKNALDFARIEWPKHYSNAPNFNGFPIGWPEIYHKFSYRPSFFDLAIWQHIAGEDVLQGLCIGRPSRGKTHLTINWIERSFAPNYFRGGILLPTLACAYEYARLLGCRRVLIKNPIDSDIYEKYGFTPFSLRGACGTYLGKELEHD
jgi:hypothetical protein